MHFDYTPFSSKYTQDFFLSILRKVPQLIQQLKGKIDLPAYYFKTKKYEHQELYFWYRYKRAMRWNRFRIADAQQFSEEQFISNLCKPDEDDLYAVALTALILCLEETFPHPNLVYDMNKNYHHIESATKCTKMLLELVNTRLYSPKTPNSSDLSDDMGIIIENEKELGLEHFYFFIFQQLKSAGLNWRFRSDYLDSIKRWEEGKIGKQSPSLDDHQTNDHNKESEIDYDFILPNEQESKFQYINFESEYFKELNEEPPLSVSAYAQVYGALPEGYPPRLDEY